ncbi:helix-turn-helix transcriptional regulator [Acinetobacter baumannii]|nr:helix-turn-helix transcriptional regulator [Acinetobacter baumannii]QNV46625.1 helix-turn-helix transcriptional regulator [Acinetobacter baumannii]QXZ49933.1 helix-turn-helix domain-containing protein [Acinetobacter baumannii]UFH77985.1 helix-turn-helix transcriptional regulator [Acinetobacter baumannii]
MSQDYHNGELAQLTGGGKYQCTAVKASKSLDTKPDGKPAKELKDRLKLSRKNAGITQEVLALSSGTNQSTISQLESGLMRSSTHIPAIAKVLGVDAHWLQTGREDSASVKINQLCLAPANAAISKTLTEGFKNDGRR